MRKGTIRPDVAFRELAAIRRKRAAARKADHEASERLTNKNAPPDALRMTLGIATEHDLMENTNMPSKKKTQTTEQPTTEQPKTEVAAAPAPEKKAKAPKAEKVAKPEKPPKEEGLVVFAFRLTEAERDAIHKAAGPARASRFVRTIAVAAAREDEAAIKAMIKEAREAR